MIFNKIKLLLKKQHIKYYSTNLLKKSYDIRPIIHCLKTTTSLFEPYTEWCLSKDAIKQLIYYLPKNNIKIIEFGSGFSTVFFSSYLNYLNLKYIITSFEHQIQFYNNLSLILKNDKNVSLLLCQLKQITENQFNQLLLSNTPIIFWNQIGHLLPQNLYSNTKIQRAFYNINLNEIVNNNLKYNVIIIDGPNGNGRSIAFPLLSKIIEFPSIILIDDYNHYNFLEELSKCFNFKILEQINIGHTAWVIAKILNKI